MDDATVARAAALACADPEFRMFARGWTGTLTLKSGPRSWTLQITDGFVAGPRLDADSRNTSTTSFDVVVSASADGWEKLLSSPPPPMFTDFFGASFAGACSVTPSIVDARFHNALRRFSELVRHAKNGSDPQAVVGEGRRQAGTHDAPVGRYIHLDLLGVDHRVYYEEAGQGIPLLCQHTAGSDGRQWRHLLEDERVTERFRVIAYDLPFHGKSLPPESVAWWAEEYRLTTDFAMAVPLALGMALSLDRPVFIGSSIGGCLALDLACFHPHHFRASISLEGALKVVGRASGDDSTQQLQIEDPGLHAAIMMMIMAPMAPESCRHETRFHYAQGAPGVFVGDLHYYQTDHDLREELDRFDTEVCPVYLLTGEYDAPTVASTLDAGRLIKGAQVQIMEGLGHFPMSEDHHRLMHYLLPILDEISLKV